MLTSLIISYHNSIVRCFDELRSCNRLPYYHLTTASSLSNNDRKNEEARYYIGFNIPSILDTANIWIEEASQQYTQSVKEHNQLKQLLSTLIARAVHGLQFQSRIMFDAKGKPAGTFILN